MSTYSYIRAYERYRTLSTPQFLPGREDSLTTSTMATSAFLLGNPTSLNFRRAEPSRMLPLKAKKATSLSLDLGFVTSQMSGLRVSIDRCDLPRPYHAISPPLLLPVARNSFFFPFPLWMIISLLLGVLDCLHIFSPLSCLSVCLV